MSTQSLQDLLRRRRGSLRCHCWTRPFSDCICMPGCLYTTNTGNLVRKMKAEDADLLALCGENFHFEEAFDKNKVDFVSLHLGLRQRSLLNQE